MNNETTTPITFEGKASEYFGIWIVNLLLSLLTLGIYSAWAKVRRKKYFYNNTLINGVGFDYHARPIAILKGRIIAVAALLLYTQGGHIHFAVPIVMLIIFIIAMPWLVVRAMTFNARNSSHRGLRFNFVGTMGAAAKNFLLYPFATMLSLGLAMPWVKQRQSQFLVNNHHFGLSAFNMQATAKQFYRAIGILVVLYFLFVIGILASIAIPAYQGYVKKAHERAQVPITNELVSEFSSGKILLPSQWILHQVGLNVVADADAQASTQDQLPTDAQPEYVDDMQAQEGADPMAGEQMTEEERQQMEAILKEYESKHASDAPKAPEAPPWLMWLMGPFILVVLAVEFFIIFGISAYYQSRVGNLIWNSTTLEQFSFRSSLRARDLLWIYMSNALAIVFSFGLATPWAQIRMMKYRASKLSIVGDGDFDAFVGDKKAEIKATGEELVDMFDVDLSFG